MLALLPAVAQAQDVATEPSVLSVLPAVIAIGAALVFRQVIAALFVGVWAGAWLVTGDPALGWFTGLLATIETYILAALADADHAAIILFSLMIGGLVGVIQKNGGTRGIVNAVVAWANSAQRGQLTTAVLGCLIFFDDYANSLIVGGTMRPITDKLRISREKLAYLVDSTAAPIACIALVTTWIGYEVGLIGSAIEQIEGLDLSAYGVFLQSIPYLFYPILALVFVFAVVITKRDFGPMLKAERRARETGQLYRPGSAVESDAGEAHLLEPPPGAPARIVNAALPIVVLVVGVLAGLWWTGRASLLESGGEMTLQNIIGEANSYTALLWASLLGVVVAVGLSVGQRILTLEEALEAWYKGARSILLAAVILVLAWALSEVNGVLGTADYLTALLSGSVAPGLLPFLIALLAAATAFATGSSWGTMGILMPLVVPLAWGVLVAEGATADLHILYASVAAVLAGAVWGDHCSPISDTTILSSLASQCDHVDHVRTQLPYAMTVGAVALLLCALPTGFGVPWWVMLPISAVVLVVFLRVVGTPVENASLVGA
ncbi:MAG: Na+/H+ antiporter NhaC family protein [Bacteroidota bacterium]